jgi:hypothetical protein
MYEKICNKFIIPIPLSIAKCMLAFWLGATSCAPTKSSIYSQLPWGYMYHAALLQSTYQISCPFSLFKESVQVRGPMWQFVTILFLRLEAVSRTPNPQAGGPPVVGCPRLFIQYIRTYSPDLGDVTLIRNLRTRHAIVTRDPLKMEIFVQYI